MRENMSENNGSPNQQRVLIIGCSLVIFMLILTCMATFAIIYRSQIPIVKNYFPTAMPTLTPIPTQTPIPHILVHAPAADLTVLKDDFTTNGNEWSTYYSLGKAEVKNGKLSFEGFNSNFIGIAYCFCGLPTEAFFEDTYYLQADLSTENLTNNSYGLVFGLIKRSEYYEFSINPIRKKYYLRKNVEDGWIDLTTGSGPGIKAYPAANTLSIYFDHGKIELFINGEKTTTYTDKTPINKGKIGFIADNDQFKLLIDNLFAYDEK